MKKLFLSTAGILLILSLSAQNQIPASLTGNWINDKTNTWDYGFFENFAIYNCDFWEYHSIKNQKEKTFVVLAQNEHTVSLEIIQKNDSTLTIRNGKQKGINYTLMAKRYPDYKTKDAKMFPEPTFRQDSATITGYYRNFDKVPDHFKQYGKNIFEVAVPCFTSSQEVKYTAYIDSTGRFSITFPVMNTQEAYTDWGRLSKQLVVEPGDQLFLFADMADLLPREEDPSWEAYRNRDKQILCMGKNARVNNELLQYKDPGISVDRKAEMEKGISDMEYLNLCEENYNKRMQYLNDYLLAHPATSEKCRFYLAVSEKYDFACTLMQHRFDLFGHENQQFQTGYIEFVNKTFPLYDKEVYTLDRDYAYFLRDYLNYVSQQSRGPYTVHVTMDEVAEALDKEGRLSPEIRQMLDEFDQLVKQFEQAEDMEKKEALIESGKEVIAEVNTNSLILETQQSLIQIAFFEKEVLPIDSLINDTILKELHIASLYYNLFDNSRAPLSNREMELFDSRIKNPDIREVLLNLNNYYAAIKNEEINHGESLVRTDHLTNIYDPDKLFKELIEPYKGKVIYLDFWGTWCSPCRENMKLIGAVEKELEGKAIVFMYLANNSPEQTWKNVIKEMKLTGENIIHYRLQDNQQALLENKLSVYSFPSYMIIDKEGNLVNTNAPSPREKDLLVAELNRLAEQ
jgi:thiol-disulfide isomerase/thioredoxin